jgi:hypothetical protein
VETGLIHGHQSLAYLMFGIALINVVLALMPNRNVKLFKILHMILMNVGRLTLVVGLSLWMVKWSGAPILTMWWAWSALLLWGPIEVFAKRFVKPEIQYLIDGGQASKKLLLGTVGQLFVIAIVFGLMSAKGLRPL